jgi:hypothetical protein
LRWREEILEAPAKGKRTILIGWFHTLPLNTQGNKKIAKYQVRPQPKENKTGKIFFVQGGK